MTFSDAAHSFAVGDGPNQRTLRAEATLPDALSKMSTSVTLTSFCRTLAGSSVLLIELRYQLKLPEVAEDTKMSVKRTWTSIFLKMSCSYFSLESTFNGIGNEAN